MTGSGSTVAMVVAIVLFFFTDDYHSIALCAGIAILWSVFNAIVAKSFWTFVVEMLAFGVMIFLAAEIAVLLGMRK